VAAGITLYEVAMIRDRQVQIPLLAAGFPGLKRRSRRSLLIIDCICVSA
jgi:hypothetical protein